MNRFGLQMLHINRHLAPLPFREQTSTATCLTTLSGLGRTQTGAGMPRFLQTRVTRASLALAEELVRHDRRAMFVFSVGAFTGSLPDAEYLFTSPALRGPHANWTMLPGTLFASNWTVETPFNPTAIESHEVRRYSYM